MKLLGRPILRIAFAVLVSLSLGACIELIPREVEENVVIHRDGRIDVTYQGTFDDLHDLALAIAADTNDQMPGEDEFRTAMDKLRSKFKNAQIDEISRGLYRLHWQDQGALGDQRLPKLLDTYGSDEIPRLLQATPYRSLSSSAFRIQTIEPDDPDQNASMPEGTRMAQVIQGYLDRFKGKVSVRVDPSMVLKHNAKSVTTEADGTLRLEWPLSMPMKNGVELLITLDPRDLPAYKLMSSPPGSNCKALIGTDCKCGPFTFVDHAGAVQANAPYEIEGPQGLQHGCTNAEGKTAAVISPVTGPCVVHMLPKDDASGCSARAPQPPKKGD